MANVEVASPGAVDRATADPLAEVALKLVWWSRPEETLRDSMRFVAQVMALGSWNDVQITQSVLGREWFRRVLEAPPAGVLDEASWVYWHNVFRIRPVPPLPRRNLV